MTRDPLRVLTWNLYIGTGLDAVFRTRRAAQVPGAVGELWRGVLASRPAARMERVAEEIAAVRPALAGLQEVARYHARAFGDRGPDVELDFLALLLAALEARGCPYRAAVVQPNFDLELPDDAGRTVRFTDRDIVLAREDVRTAEPRAGRFAAATAFGAGGIAVEVPRGWVSVRAEHAGTAVRFVDTHLEIGGWRSVQEAQARELVAALHGETLPTILVGDLNSSGDGAGGSSYRIVRAAGFADAWAELRPGEPGATCCRPSDLGGDSLWMRIDVVLHRGLVAVDAARVGAAPESRAAGGRWPSDHAGVVTAFATT